METRYLELLAEKYRNIDEVTAEIMNLGTILSLPKGTEFFFSDLHGEHLAFIHLLKSASGVIKNKIDLLFEKQLSLIQRQQLAHLIYYPKEQLEKINPDDQWYELTIYYLIALARFCSSKYTRSKVSKKLPKQYSYVITEMLSCHNDQYINEYYHDIISNIIMIDNAKSFIIALCQFIRDICIDNIHIIGDIFDRGPRPDLIIDELMQYDQVDIQWGNHDISWMGAACGNQALIANVIRIALSYNNFDLLEDGYGINLRPLSEFAREVYQDDDCLKFYPHELDDNLYDQVNVKLTAKMHKAITIIQLKLEGRLIENHPEYQMNHQIWLKQIDFDNKIVNFQNQIYQLSDNYFPTVDSNEPLKLTEKEEQLMKILTASFTHSKRLQQHIEYLYRYGNMYKIINGNLLFHGCIPLDKSGKLRKVNVDGKDYQGKELLDKFEEKINLAYYQNNQDAIDLMWYLWCGKNSPLFGKSKLALFEKYFIQESKLINEIKNSYYKWIEQEQTCKMILKCFDLDSNTGHIINGHMPVKTVAGEKPVKANGRLYVIDGGISKSYHSKTGTAGYTLIFDSQHLQLAKHLPYHDLAKDGLMCLTPEVEIMETNSRIKNRDCDVGKELSRQLQDLKELLFAYRNGIIKEK
ncbi:fructose-1,6-bisphosphatase [uncultured Thomasclavelia sp.]|uniref:fructose-1,6-bisphosphatase n=1 Tax=uncultured Thomasclavelia sp. TaxID=3025759 RepID=UPI002607EFDF|nr:fructose-1,6-bisphosphatase [uncultured Thomasclavelia sp.]